MGAVLVVLAAACGAGSSSEGEPSHDRDLPSGGEADDAGTVVGDASGPSGDRDSAAEPDSGAGRSARDSGADADAAPKKDGGAPRACSPGETQCATGGVETCGDDGTWSAAVACLPQHACAGGRCGTLCTRTATSQLSEPSPYSSAIEVDYTMIGGGGGGGGYGGGGGGGSSAILANGALVEFAAGGDGGGTNGLGRSATPVSGSFTLAAGATLAVYVGGGGGGGGSLSGAGGGGGGSGYVGGGAGSQPCSGICLGPNDGGAGGKNIPGAASSGDTAGLSLAGSPGLQCQVTSGTTAGVGDSGGVGACGGGGGGGFGGGGGGGGTGSPGSGGSDGTNGRSSMDGSLGGAGGIGAAFFAQSPTPFPTAAGRAGPAISCACIHPAGGNAGLVVMRYVSPTGACSL